MCLVGILRSNASRQPTAFATITARNDAVRPRRWQSLQGAPVTRMAVSAISGRESRTSRSSCAQACEARLRACGASVRNLRVSVDGKLDVVGCPNLQWGGREGGLPTVARPRVQASGGWWTRTVLVGTASCSGCGNSRRSVRLMSRFRQRSARVSQVAAISAPLAPAACRRAPRPAARRRRCRSGQV